METSLSSAIKIVPFVAFVDIPVGQAAADDAVAEAHVGLATDLLILDVEGGGAVDVRVILRRNAGNITLARYKRHDMYTNCWNARAYMKNQRLKTDDKCREGFG